MTLWQINQYRAGYIQANTAPLTPEEEAAAELEKITDDDFFDMMNQEEGNLTEITEDDFMLGLKQ